MSDAVHDWLQEQEPPFFLNGSEILVSLIWDFAEFNSLFFIEFTVHTYEVSRLSEF